MVTPEGLPVVDAFCLILEEGGFGTYDSLRRSLATSSGVGAAARGQTKKPRKPTKGDREQAKQIIKDMQKRRAPKPAPQAVGQFDLEEAHA